MNNEIRAEHFPWIAGREKPDAKPTYKIIARSKSLTGDSIVMLHKAGSEYVMNYYICDVVTKEEILREMDEKEANLLRWVVRSEITDPLEDLLKLSKS